MQNVNKSDTIKIKGIAGSARTFGSADICLHVEGRDLNHRFVLMKAFDKHMHGILGSDFFEKYSASINYENFEFSFVVNDKRITIPMESSFNNSIKIPARCEVIKYFKVDKSHECVVIPEELGRGIFVAGILAKPNKDNLIPVRILNVRENEVVLKNFKPKTLNANEFQITTFKEFHSKSVDRVSEVLALIKMTHLNKEEKSAVEHICAKYADVFHLEREPLTVTNIYKHDILLKDNAVPVYQKQYRLPYSQKSEIQKQISKMLKDGIIEPTTSAWSSPLLIVPKKPDIHGNRNYRICLDYRKLNLVLEDIKFPLPNITEILDFSFWSNVLLSFRFVAGILSNRIKSSK